MVETGAGSKKIRQVEQFHIVDIQYQAHEYFGLLGIGNVVDNSFPDPVVISKIQNLNGDTQQVQNFYDRVRPRMIAKEIEDQIKKTPLKKLSFTKGDINDLTLGVSKVTMELICFTFYSK